MCFLAQEKAEKEKASLGQQLLHPGRRGREQGDRGEDPQVVEANSSSSGTFSLDSPAWGLLYLQFLQQSGHCIPGGHVSLSLPFLFPAIQEWLPFLIQKHTGILFPTDQTRVGGLGLPELQWLPPLQGAWISRPR